MTGQFELARRMVTNAFVLLRVQRWDEILRYTPHPDPVPQLEWRVARVIAFIGKGLLTEAGAAFAEYEAAERALPRNALWWSDPIADVSSLRQRAR